MDVTLDQPLPRTPWHPACAAAGLSLALLGALGGCGGGSGGVEPAIGEPEIVSSRDGVLHYTLTQAPAQVTVAGQTFTSNVFNGQYIPPVLKLQRGDRLELLLRNRIGPADIEIEAAEASNLHYHGMVVPPAAPGDDVFLHIDSGADYRYRWQVPADHAQGPHWYHPHSHGRVEPQILSGMSGLLMVDGLVSEHYPAFAALTERHLLLKDIALPDAPDTAPKSKTINGLLGGVLRLRPNEMQVWHLGNLGADSYFDLVIDGAELWEISRDGNVLVEPKRLENVFMSPGSRSTVVVVAPGTPGRYPMRTRAVETGPQGDPNPALQLGSLIVSGSAVDASAPQAALRMPAQARDTVTPTIEEVAALPITRRRTITFSESDDGNTFYIDGKVYSGTRDDITVNLGDVEEWTLRNTSGERHVFHIHQLDFLVKSINNGDIAEKGLRDVIDIPYQVGDTPGEVKIVVPFTNPIMVGRFVYHCHIVEHEDNGMMANLVVLPAGQTAAMAPARMRTVAAAPGPFDGLARRLGLAPAVPVPSTADDALCRSPDARPVPRVGARVSALFGGSDLVR